MKGTGREYGREEGRSEDKKLVEERMKVEVPLSNFQRALHESYNTA
jgi:hypothetical protein